MNGLWKIVCSCAVVVLVLVVDLAESDKRIRYNARRGKNLRRLPELRSLPYEEILRFFGKKKPGHGPQAVTTPAMSTTPKPPQVVCYGDLGCFSNEYPFDNGGAVPQSPEYINTMFYVFSKSNPTIEARQAISYDDPASVASSYFDPTKPVKVLIHGFFSYPITGDPFWAGDAMREILKRDDFNVIIVDWNKGSEFPNYAQAASNTRLVAAQVAKLINFLINETGCSLDQFHLIGHSLGAHLSGYVGSKLPGLPRITGLDPAEPYFEDEDPVVRLDPTDAQLVDVIHTDGGEVLSGAWGLDQPSGHVDFYPNGGKGQPGCGNTWLSSITTIFDSSTTLDDVVDCSHNRAYEFYIESINNPCKFVAYPCRTYDDFANGNCRDCFDNACAVMGYDVGTNMAARGSLYLNTRDTAPYCMYEYKLTFKTKAGMDFTRGNIVVIIGGDNQATAPLHLFDDNSYGLDQDTTYSGIVTSTVGIDSVTELRLTYLATSNILYSWGNSADLIINRVDVQSISSRGAGVSYCGEMLLRDGEMITITSFNNCTR